MAQGGGYDAAYQKKAVQAPVENEADNGLRNLRGTVAMARTGDPHSATAQFFVSLADNALLDHKGKTDRDWGYTVFGKVTEGMDVVDRMGTVRTGAQGPFAKDAPHEPLIITSARSR
jgi:cyclophilin family peptidyl-prolyl cis-trans isomerase